MIDNIICRSFLEKVFDELNKVNISTLESCMLGGLGEYLLAISKLEDILGTSLPREKTDELFDRLNIFLKNLNQDIHHIPNDDELGLLLSIGTAAYKSNRLNKVCFVNIVGRTLNRHFHYPLQLRSLYYPGLLTLLFWKDEDNLFRYSCEEKMLLLLRECEDILANSMNDKSEIAPGILHSMLYYLQMCHNHRIGTFKTHMLIAKISAMAGAPDTSSLMNSLIRQDALANIPDSNGDEIAGYMGLFCMLYNNMNPPFSEKQHDIHISATRSSQQYLRIVVGSALGLLSDINRSSYNLVHDQI